jgi:mono/diheme cytochrome c family protein
MSNLRDLFLSKPFPIDWAQVLLFITFSFHLLFVLLMLGTAILAISYLISGWAGNQGRPWAGKILKSFLAHKSLAVVLGVGPLLLIQVNYTVPFFNATSIFAPYWLLILVFLITAFILFDLLRLEKEAFLTNDLLLGVAALASLLFVPAVFVLILTTAENPDKWLSIITSGFKLDRFLTAHWLLRYLHVLGAALVFGAAFHHFFTGKHSSKKNDPFPKWIFFGLLFQFAGGPLLAVSVPGGIGLLPAIFMFIGITAAAFLMWNIFSGYGKAKALRPAVTATGLLIILYAMLLTRQGLQNRKFTPLMKNAVQNSAAYEKKVDRYQKEAINAYKAHLALVYDNGKTIYGGSCAFCHGAAGNGKGPEAGNLAIPPEDLASMRTTHQYLYATLLKGIAGTAMPYFDIFDKTKLDGLITYLNDNFKILGAPEAIRVTIPDSAMKEARQTYASVCALCHGADGKGAKFARSFQPSPPDFTQFSLLPDRAFEVITNGYSGTMMTPYRQLPENVRWGLVEIISSKRSAK